MKVMHMLIVRHQAACSPYAGVERSVQAVHERRPAEISRSLYQRHRQWLGKYAQGQGLRLEVQRGEFHHARKESEIAKTNQSINPGSLDQCATSLLACSSNKARDSVPLGRSVRGKGGQLRNSDPVVPIGCVRPADGRRHGRALLYIHLPAKVYSAWLHPRCAVHVYLGPR